MQEQVGGAMFEHACKAFAFGVRPPTEAALLLLLRVERRFFDFRFFDQLAEPFGKQRFKHPLDGLALARDLRIQFPTFVTHDSQDICAS
jgi:hypothetical protein